MQALILEEDPRLRSAVAAALAEAGCDVAAVGGIAAAKAIAREAAPDVLVLGERVEGRLAHDVALLAEWRNPLLGAVVLSDRTGPEADELFALLPSLGAVLGRETPARTVALIALGTAAPQGGESADDRLARRWTEAGGDADAAEDDAGLANIASAPRPEPAGGLPALPSFLRLATARPEPAPAVRFQRAAPPARREASSLPARRAAEGGRRLHLA